MSSLSASIKKIRLKMKALECSQHFPHYKSIGRSKADNSAVLGPIRPNFKLVQYVMDVLVTLECSQHFPHYNPMGAIRCHGHQSSDLIWPKT